MWWRIDKSIDKLIDKSIDKAAARNLADYHSDRAREGATPGGCRTGASASGLGRSTGGSLPPSPALEGPGTSLIALASKCDTGPDLRAPP